MLIHVNQIIIKVKIILFSIVISFLISGCSPIAAIGAVGSTVAKTVENALEEEEPKPAGTQISREQRLEEIAAANLNLGIAYMQQGEYRKALEKLNRAKLAKNDYPPVYNALGLLYQKLGENELAESNYKHGINLNPNDSLALNNYGQFLCTTGRFEEAESVFKESSENPFNKNPEIAISNAGTCALTHDQPDKAEAYFTRALVINPKVSPALLQMAELSFDQGNYLLARDYLNRYLENARHTSRSLWLGIRIEHELGDKDALSSYALLLRNNFPDTEEARLLEDSGMR